MRVSRATPPSLSTPLPPYPMLPPVMAASGFGSNHNQFDEDPKPPKPLSSASAGAALTTSQYPTYSQAFLAHISPFLSTSQQPAQPDNYPPYPVIDGQTVFPPLPSGQLPPLPSPAQPYLTNVSASTTTTPRHMGWLPAEDAALLAAIEKHGSNWDLVAADINKAAGGSRTRMAARQRHRRMTEAATSHRPSSGSGASSSSLAQATATAPRVSTSSAYAEHSFPGLGLGGSVSTSSSAPAAGSSSAQASTLARPRHDQPHQYGHPQRNTTQPLPPQQHQPPTATPPSTRVQTTWRREEDDCLATLLKPGHTYKDIFSEFCDAFPGTTRTYAAVAVRLSTRIKAQTGAKGRRGGTGGRCGGRASGRSRGSSSRTSAQGSANAKEVLAAPLTTLTHDGPVAEAPNAGAAGPLPPSLVAPRAKRQVKQPQREPRVVSMAES